MNLAPTARGAFWMIVASAAFAIQAAIVKHVGTRLDPFVIAFCNAGFGLIFLLPIVARDGRDALATKRPFMHLMRALAGAGGLMGMVYSMVHLPLADATAIAFTKPLFGVVLAGLFLGERVGLQRWLATAIGFAGVLFIVRPGSAELELAHLAALVGALCAADVIVLVKKLQGTERNTTILVYFSFTLCLMCLGPALWVWTTPTLRELAWLASIAALLLVLQYSTLRAMRVADASAMMPFDYARLVFVVALGYALFGDVPDAWTMIGMAVISLATLYLGYHESRLSRRALSAAIAGERPGVAKAGE
jgi:drug/metabolite transporter (DMT)-like permease